MSQPVFPTIEDTAQAFVLTFSTPHGEKVLRHLRARVDQPSDPNCADGWLHHQEGQRNLVRYIEDTVERGKQP